MRFFFGQDNSNTAAQKNHTVPPTGMDHAKMLNMCLPGPGIHVLVGEEEEFQIPKKLLLYHSPKVCKKLLSPNEDTIIINNHKPNAFNHIYRWMVSDKLNVYSNLLAPIGDSATPIPSIEEALPKACTLLAEIYTLTIHVGIAGIQNIIIAEFKDIIDRAREYQHPTPIIPSTILRVHENMQEYGYIITNKDSNDPLWETMLDELVTAFCSKPAPIFESYEPVWQALPFLYTRIIKTMHEKEFASPTIKCPACGSGAVQAVPLGNAAVGLGKTADGECIYAQLVAAAGDVASASNADRGHNETFPPALGAMIEEDDQIRQEAMMHTDSADCTSVDSSSEVPETHAAAAAAAYNDATTLVQHEDIWRECDTEAEEEMD